MRNDYFGFAASVQGAAHKKIEKECQDRSKYICGKGYRAVIVSDGHGADKHFRSSMGADTAIEVSESSIRSFAKGISGELSPKRRNEMLKNFEKNIILNWRERINIHRLMYPFRNDELDNLSDSIQNEVREDPYIAYGATLLICMLCGESIYIIQLGDGECRLLVGDNIVAPLLNDESLTFGKTTSLCGNNAFQNIRDCIVDSKKVKGCVLSSDGVINSFDNTMHFDNFCKRLFDGYIEDRKCFANDVKDYLPVLSKEGSGDDMSVALFVV